MTPQNVAQPEQVRRASVVAAEEVRALMARRRVRQRAIANLLDIAQAGVSDRLTGKTAFTVDELGLLASYFGVDANTLLPGFGKQGVGGAVCAPWDLNPEPADLGSTFNHAPSPAYAERREVARQRHLHLLAPAPDAPDRSDERLLGAAG